MNVRTVLLLLVAGCGAPNRASPEPATGPLRAPSTESSDAGPSAGGASATPVTTADVAPKGEAGAEATGGSVLIGEITAPKKFNPGPTLAGLVPDLLTCYRKVRGSVPTLRGKLNLRVVVSETGAAQGVAAEPGGRANDPTLVSCIGEALKGAAFPKPGGTAIIVVPLVFRP
jgi:hypothetical protein